MGADLNNIVKCQKLTDDHVQFLIYQILRGLKVRIQECSWQFVEELRPVAFVLLPRGSDLTQPVVDLKFTHPH